MHDDDIVQQKRDYRNERAKAALGKARRLTQLREKRTASWPSGFALTARALVLASLPLRPAKETRIIRTIPLGDGSVLRVTFLAASDMPFGADTNLLHFMTDRAVKTKNRLIEWRSAAEYLRFMGQDPDSRKNIYDLQERFRRIAGLGIHLVIKNDELNLERGEWLPVIERFQLPASIAALAAMIDRNDKTLDTCGLLLSETLFSDAIHYPVPIPKDLLRELRNEPMTFRLAILLGYRSFAARSESIIPWSDLSEQIGAGYSEPRQFRSEINDSLGKIKVFWPELEALPLEHGLLIGPARNNQHLFTNAHELRHLSPA